MLAVRAGAPTTVATQKQAVGIRFVKHAWDGFFFVAQFNGSHNNYSCIKALAPETGLIESAFNVSPGRD